MWATLYTFGLVTSLKHAQGLTLADSLKWLCCSRLQEMVTIPTWSSTRLAQEEGLFDSIHYVYLGTPHQEVLMKALALGSEGKPIT